MPTGRPYTTVTLLCDGNFSNSYKVSLKALLSTLCIASLGSFPSPWTVYPDFDSCYSHFMPHRMTPSVRHRAIEVLYYYYYYYYYYYPGTNVLP